jgi:hypothetical protein
MNTKLSELYEIFLSKITDYSLIDPNLMEDELNEELFAYFKSARTKFYKSKQSLNTVEDEVGELEFEVELTGYELEILTHLMLVEYLKPQVLSSEVLRQSLSDKDFKIYSQANQLRELNLLYRLLQKEAQKMITEYSFMGMTDDVRKKLWDKK